MGVIGVVAAMTIPTLINNYQEKVTVTKVKKMYSMLNQIIKLAEVENGPVNTWNLPTNKNGGSQKFYEYIKPYLKVSKECVEDNSWNCLDTNTDYYWLNGTKWKDPNTNYGTENYARIILSDGSLLWFRTNMSNKGCTETNQLLSNICAQIWYDVNGSAKPNTCGKDIFYWFLAYDKKFYFGQVSDKCYLDNLGGGCADWILKHDNMDYPKTKQTE